MKLNLSLLLFLLLAFRVSGQQASSTLSGFITEAGSSELLMGVNVYVSAF